MSHRAHDRRSRREAVTGPSVASGRPSLEPKDVLSGLGSRLTPAEYDEKGVLVKPTGVRPLLTQPQRATIFAVCLVAFIALGGLLALSRYHPHH